MNIFQSFGNAVRYLAEGISQFFGKNHYPEVGVQPFDGEPYSEWVSVDRSRSSKSVVNDSEAAETVTNV
ncbi:MAG TPA: hypothetical protein V6D10_00785 [Trichocoleus sp.]